MGCTPFKEPAKPSPPPAAASAPVVEKSARPVAQHDKETTDQLTSPATAPAPAPQTNTGLQPVDDEMLRKQAEILGLPPDMVKAIRPAQAKEKRGIIAAAGKDVRTCRVSVHPHELYSILREDGWACDGIMLPGGCVSGYTGKLQASGLVRFTCMDDNYDLCEKCAEKYKI